MEVWSASWPGRFIPPPTHQESKPLVLTQKEVEWAQELYEWLEQKKILEPTKTWIQTLVIQPMASWFTDCTIPAPTLVLYVYKNLAKSLHTKLYREDVM
jgi:hypothetical protein